MKKDQRLNTSEFDYDFSDAKFFGEGILEKYYRKLRNAIEAAPKFILRLMKGNQGDSK